MGQWLARDWERWKYWSSWLSCPWYCRKVMGTELVTAKDWVMGRVMAKGLEVEVAAEVEKLTES